MRPLLNYFGGKWIIAEEIIKHFPPHDVYVEPFGGGASVLLKKTRSKLEVYNDIDEEVVNLFQVLRDQPKELHEKIKLTPYSLKEYEAAFEGQTTCVVEKARRTVVKSYFGMGSSIRDEKHSGFRRSKSSNTSPAISFENYKTGLDAVIERLLGVIIESNDYATIINKYDTPETLFYLDPPYTLDQRAGGHQYRHDFTDEDQLRFLESIKNLKGYCIVSGYDNELYNAKLGTWQKVFIKTHGHQVQKLETLWLCEKTQREQRQLNLFEAKK
jgi:DNA adenine methylase